MRAGMPGVLQRNYLLYLILLTAIGFLIILLSMIRPGVFFSGDGGLKFLIIKQLHYSGEYKKILSVHPQWVKEIWAAGYYPFQPNFVYTVNGDHLITFPPFFQYLNSFFYSQFGFYGIYVVPALSVVLTWLSFLRILSVLRTSTGTKALGLFLLAFCTPLTIYGAVYWEHSLATFLVFTGVAYFIQKKSAFVPALISGLLFGTAVWFREETIVFTGLLTATICWNNRKRINRTDMLFITGVAVSVLFYFLFNYYAFGTFFGVHGYQIMRDATLHSQLLKGIKQVFKINFFQLTNFPIIVFCLLILFLFFKKQQEKSSRFFQLSLVIMLFLLVTPFLLPSDGDKQWGARFFLPAVPPAILIIVFFANNNNWQAYLRKRKVAAFLSALVIVYGIYQNVYKAGTYLQHDYAQRVYPTLKYVESEPCNNIIIDNQYIAQELTVEFNHRNFFLVTKEGQLETLLNRLKMAGQKQCIFISMNIQGTFFPDIITKNQNIVWQKTGSYDAGKYIFPE